MVNLLVLQGRIAKKFIDKNGNAYSSLAVETYKGDTFFIDIAVFGKSADFCLHHLDKGSMVLIEGSLSISNYQDKKYISCIVKTISKIGNERQERKIDETVSDEQLEETVDEPSVDLDEVDDGELPF